ncbi:hypothetical protein POX_b02680 [Penicillium oxalicum]|uniref:hypothetical protein n=1 Tax=Penicillium oxalicum TaxID=69781 RepID=UPI0020B84244|nr:hypothetical protein POX_b02680 [Penicillium oxalicum]KAI2792640.1 hypothetical protein POX_b02680 [Penicillium oxalicum]
MNMSALTPVGRDGNNQPCTSRISSDPDHVREQDKLLRSAPRDWLILPAPRWKPTSNGSFHRLAQSSPGPRRVSRLVLGL